MVTEAAVGFVIIAVYHIGVPISLISSHLMISHYEVGSNKKICKPLSVHS